MTTGNCELWHPISGECHFMPYRDQSRQSLCGRLFASVSQQQDVDVEEEALLHAAEATSPIPLQRVHIVFNGQNVWANLQVVQPSEAFRLSFELENMVCWRPLFAPGREEEMIHLPA